MYYQGNRKIRRIDSGKILHRSGRTHCEHDITHESIRFNDRPGLEIIENDPILIPGKYSY